MALKGLKSVVRKNVWVRMPPRHTLNLSATTTSFPESIGDEEMRETKCIPLSSFEFDPCFVDFSMTGAWDLMGLKLKTHPKPNDPFAHHVSL